jgi:aldose 1-epimerase
MDFRKPKPLGQDIDQNFEPLKLQHGYDHNFEVFCSPCAVLRDPTSGRSMAITTTCPGLQVYTGNFLGNPGKGGIYYGKRSGVALEPQFYPDSVHHPEWPQPITPAGQLYKNQIRYQF